MVYPVHRLRRLRRNEGIRRMVREADLSPDDLIYPLFIPEGQNVSAPLEAMPGLGLLSGSPLREEVKAVRDLGIPAVLLFGVVEDIRKDEHATAGYAEDGPVQEAVRQIKNTVPDLVIVTDLCLCEYISHGHCGILKNGEIDNDLTLECIKKIALSHARAGADVIAPSGVMDGVVQAIRTVLDRAGYQNVLTMPYAAKFASQFYGPFKAATKSIPGESKHATHQVDIANGRQALHKICQDIEEGADIIIIKPALTSLDIIARAREQYYVPIAAYNVSGEYKMIHAASEGDPAYRTRLMLEVLTCIKRAGADMIITYFAKDAARVLTE
jgi:porphobilinogen synthase